MCFGWSMDFIYGQMNEKELKSIRDVSRYSFR